MTSRRRYRSSSCGRRHRGPPQDARLHNELARSLSVIATEQSKQLSLTLTRFRNTAAALDSVQLDSTLRNLQATSHNLAAFTDSLRGTAQQLNAVLAKANSGDGTLGRLLNDPASTTISAA